MRVALAGARSTGKTSLARTLAETLGEVYVGGFARRAGRLLNLSPRTISSIQQLLRFQEVVRTETFLVHSLMGGYVADRTLADVYAYTKLGIKRFAPRLSVACAALREVEAKARLSALFYDLVVFVPIEFPQEDDGFRPEGEEGRKEEEREILAAVERFYSRRGVPVVSVSGSLENRKRQVLDALRLSSREGRGSWQNSRRLSG